MKRKDVGSSSGQADERFAAASCPQSAPEVAAGQPEPHKEPPRTYDRARKQILIIGGAGFIGSHLADELLACGHRVRVLDNLSPQVHGGIFPDYYNREAEFILGDVRDRATLERALGGVDAVFHFAAAIGVGQSMYEIERYMSVNNLGTAVLLEALIKRPVAKLIVASSMSVYGEGLYRSPDGALRQNVERSLAQLKAGKWELYDSAGNQLEPVPTPETKSPSLASIYALSKYTQEKMCILTGRAYNIPTVALRFFNVIGTRQALCNPYTGVLAIFASRYLNDKPPIIFEDGLQKRDFVSVRDAVRASRFALEVNEAAGMVFNVGSGRFHTVCQVARQMAVALGKQHLEPVVTGKYRMGDIRHCFADIGRARSILGYEPQVTLEEAMVELAGWLAGRVARDDVDSAKSELEKRGLTL